MSQKYTKDSSLTDFLLKASLSPLTKQNYVDRIRQLEKRLEKTIFEIMRDADTSIEAIRKAYPLDTTRKVYMTVIMSLFRHVPHLKEQLFKSYEAWSSAFKDHDKAIEERYKMNEPTERQKAGYVRYEEIKAKRFTLPKGSMDRLILAFYTDIYPLRADFNRVRLYKSVPEQHEPNYIHMRRAGACKLYLNEYKTQAKHGTFEKELPESLCEEIYDSLEEHPRDWLFINANKEPFELSNSFIHYINNRLKRLFGKPLTISLIRHSFISTLDFNKLTIAEKEIIAKEMTHTIRLQDQYRLIFNKE
jgi:hypothetical protein